MTERDGSALDPASKNSLDRRDDVSASALGLFVMTPFQVFTGTFVLVLIFAALVAFLTLSAAH